MSIGTLAGCHSDDGPAQDPSTTDSSATGTTDKDVGDSGEVTDDADPDLKDDLADSYNFDRDYIKSVEMLKMICLDAAQDYVKMLFLDTICANPDRHTFNFGLLRDADTGEVLGLAPNVDNNMALISRGYPKNIARKNDLLIKLFNELMQHDENLKKYIPALSEDLIKNVIKSVGMRVKTNEITKFIMNGYDLIEK